MRFSLATFISKQQPPLTESKDDSAKDRDEEARGGRGQEPADALQRGRGLPDAVAQEAEAADGDDAKRD